MQETLTTAMVLNAKLLQETKAMLYRNRDNQEMTTDIRKTILNLERELLRASHLATCSQNKPVPLFADISQSAIRTSQLDQITTASAWAVNKGIKFTPTL
jgi:nanoRNase/pAp phosphatase (c-di-AMP/oligoRNAs hydrolase)